MTCKQCPLINDRISMLKWFNFMINCRFSTTITIQAWSAKLYMILIMESICLERVLKRLKQFASFMLLLYSMRKNSQQLQLLCTTFPLSMEYMLSISDFLLTRKGMNWLLLSLRMKSSSTNKECNTCKSWTCLWKQAMLETAKKRSPKCQKA